MKNVIGIDIGGSKIKAALVDVGKGATVTKRNRIGTPDPATPEAVMEVCKKAIEPFPEDAPVGVGFPGVIQDGVVRATENLDQSWVDFAIEKKLSDFLGRPVRALNDADAAGVAEVRFGAGKGVSETVILLTVGTGLGSAVFTDGHLVRNTEFGRMLFGGDCEAELFVADPAREKAGLSDREWAERFQKVLTMLETLYWPKMIIVGGGGAKDFDKVADRIQTRARLVHAEAKNKAGIIGAAYWASR